MAEDTLTIEPLTPERQADFLDLFETRAFVDHPEWASCYCHFPHADHANVVWAKRTGAENRAATCRGIADGAMRGWLAYSGSQAVGWCNAGPRTRVEAMLGETDPDAERIGAIVCFIVAPALRGQGIARRLLDAACSGLREQSFEWAEGYPRLDARNAGANHFGPRSMFAAAGFVEHGPEGDDGIVVRRRLADR